MDKTPGWSRDSLSMPWRPGPEAGASSQRAGRPPPHRAVWQALTGAAHRRRQRLRLGELSDHLLRDIGITRGQALREARRWFWE